LGQIKESITVFSDSKGPNFQLDKPLPKVAAASFDIAGTTFNSRVDNTIEGGIIMKGFVDDIEEVSTTSGEFENVQQFVLANNASNGNSFDLVGTYSVDIGDFVQSVQNYEATSLGNDVPIRFEIVDVFPQGSNTRIVVQPAFVGPISSIYISSQSAQTGRFNMQIPLINPGRNKVVIKSFDQAGNKGRSEWEYVFYDNVKPQINLKSTTPHDGDVVGILSLIDASILDNFGVNAQKVRLDVDGTLKSNIFTSINKGGDLSYSISIPPTVDFQTFNLEIIAEDLAANEQKFKWSFTYDKDAPTLISSIPRYVNTATPKFTLQFNTNVDSITVTIDGTSQTTSKIDSTSFSLTSTTLSEEQHEISIEATTGSKKGIANRKFTVDLTPPIIEILSSNITSTLTPTIRGSFSDESGIKNVLVLANDKNFPAEIEENTYTQGFFQAIISIDNTTSGKVKATDKAGNIAEKTFTITPFVVDPPFKITFIEDAIWMGGSIYRTDKNKVIAHGTLKRGDIDFIFEEILNDQAVISGDEFVIELFLDTRSGEEIANDINLIGVDYSGNQIPLLYKLIADRKPPKEPEFEYN